MLPLILEPANKVCAERGMRHISLISLISFLAFVFFIDVSEAQFTSTLGTSGLTGQRFDCVSYPKGQDIVIYDRNGKSRKVSKSSAIRNIDGSLKRADKRIAGVKQALKIKNARIKQILKSASILLPKVAEELENLKREIPRLEALFESVKAQKMELKFLKSAINGCGKEPPPINGGNTVVSYSVLLPKSGDQAYGIHAVHAFAVPPGVPDRICVSVNDGPYYEQGIRYSVGTTFYDGSGTSNPVSHAEPAPLGTGYLPFFGRAGLFRHGKFDQHMAEVQEQLSLFTFRLFIPSAKRSCPRA